jgi:6-phosphogluconolactonase
MGKGHFVYVSCQKGRRIDVAWLDGNSGALEPVTSLSLPGDGMALALAPGGGHLFAALYGDGQDDKQPALASLRIDPATGEVTLDALVAAPARTSFVTVAPGGRFLLAASVGGSVIASFPISDDGVIRQEAGQVVTVKDGAHQIMVVPQGGRVLVPNLGGDIVQQFRFDDATGALEDVGLEPFEVGPGFAPRHLTFHPNGRTAYLLNEKGGTVDQLVLDGDELRFEATFPYQPPADDGDAWGAQILVSPDGRHLYTSERNSSTIQAHAIDPGTGVLVLRGVWKVEACPRNFALSADGRWLVVAGETSDHIAAHGLDPDTGKLTVPPAGLLATGAGPVWVAMLAGEVLDSAR